MTEGQVTQFMLIEQQFNRATATRMGAERNVILLLLDTSLQDLPGSLWDAVARLKLAHEDWEYARKVFEHAIQSPLVGGEPAGEQGESR